MDAFRPRKAHITSLTDTRTFKQANTQVQKSDSTSPITSITPSRDLLMWESLSQAPGTPIKKLLAEEMSKESESKKKSSPSVIARLMGFDGLPSQQLSHKQQKSLSDNNRRRLALPEKSQRTTTSSSRQSSRKSSKDDKEFKDVFEVLESNGSSLQETANPKFTEAEMLFVRQRFLDTACLSSDEKFEDSDEVHDAVDDLGSKKDLLLKYIEQPDSLFKKHLHNLRAAPSLHCSHVPGKKLSRSPECEDSGVAGKSEIEPAWKNHRKNPSYPSNHSLRKHSVHDLPASSNVNVQREFESSVIPTRIVVLKPNFGKEKNASTTVSSPRTSYDFLSEYNRQVDYPSNDRAAELCGRKRFLGDAGHQRFRSKESREIAKEITRHMRNSIESGRLNPSSSGFRGYAGDESSSNKSDNESANESDGSTVISGNATGWSNRDRPSSSRSAESSVSKEAKKRLSERWKMAHRSVDMGVASRGRTLGEMLAMPDSERRPAKADAMISERGFGPNFFGNDRTPGWIEPLGISSRDGWKDEFARNLSRSRSVPASFTTSGSPKTGMHRETLRNDRYLQPRDALRKPRTKPVKGYSNQRRGSSCVKSRSRVKEFHFCEGSCTDHGEGSPEIQFWSNLVQSNISKDNLLKQCRPVSEVSATCVSDASLGLEDMVDATIENEDMPSEPTDLELQSYMLVKNNPSASDPEIATSKEPSIPPPEKGAVQLQNSVEELESTESSKEAEQPSPVSVLETPFPDDLSSSSECFESLCADLHGLRMQLQLLKLESEAYTESPMLISSDEDLEEHSIGIADERRKAEESKELSYVVDVLLESGINDADPDTFMASWHSLECPLNPLIFEELEKKHCNVTSWPRSERKMLFDCINSALLVINRKYVNPRPWLRPATATPRWTGNRLEDGIHKMLANLDMKAKKDTAEMAVVTDLQWLDLRDDIDVVGREIERLLTEELLDEIVEA